jgi:A/G-specific adenine glycosylase
VKHLNSEALLEWYGRVKRDLPWRLTKDPYTIWVSEIILQQTRVDQGLPYFERFIERFPNIESLATCEEDEVLKIWEGLGYYSRARNMRSAAHQILNDFNGEFPTSFDDILTLKGIGPYTAAAISSMAFNIPEPSVDGNVLRVATRLLADSNSIDEGKTKKRIQAFLKKEIPIDRPGDFNQAMMELGATVCLPKSVECDVCPLAGNCQAHLEGLELEYPVRTKKVKKRNRYFIYMIPELNGKTLLARRLAGDIWEGLYQFPLIEVEGKKAFLNPAATIAKHELMDADCFVTRMSETIRHVLSHQNLSAIFIHVEVEKMNSTGEFITCRMDELSNFAMPRLITQYLENIACD